MPFVEQCYIYEVPALPLLLRPDFYPILATLLKMPTTSAAENQSTAGLQDAHQPPAVIFGRGESCATPALPGSDLIAGADPCKTGQAGGREKIQRGKDEHF